MNKALFATMAAAAAIAVIGGATASRAADLPVATAHPPVAAAAR